MSLYIEPALLDIYKDRYKNHTTAELCDAVNRLGNAVKAYTATDPAKATILLKEMQYVAERHSKLCDELEACREAELSWLPAQNDFRQKAVLNIPNAVSPNGQLVAAILEEEDGLTAEEIHCWCDELNAFDIADFQQLLDGLESEKVLSKDKNEKYHLEQLCTPDLYFDKEKCRRKLEQSYMLHKDVARRIFELIEKKKRAVSEAAIREEIFPSVSVNDEYNRDMLAGNVTSVLLDMRFGDILGLYRVDGKRLYYFPMLGHKGVEK